MEPYVDYNYYKNNWYGTKVSEAEFPRLALLATNYVNNITYNRIGDNITIPVQLATCSVIDEYKNQETPEVASRTSGKQSETYVQSGKSKEEKLYEAVYQWLINTGLLYRGVDPYVYE